MRTWQQDLTAVDRVRSHTAPDVLEGLDRDLRVRVAGYADAGPERIRARLAELDDEWDIERVLITNAATLAGLGVLAGLRRRPLLLLPLAVTGFLLQHGLQGWCPPLTVFRRLGVRTRREIDLERYALKVLRGDLGTPPATDADELLDLAVRH